MRWGHGVYFGKVVPRIGGLLSDPTAYRYLPKSVAYLPEPDALVGLVRAAAFGDAKRELLTAGISAIWIPTDYVRFILDYGHLWIKDSPVIAGGRNDYGVDALGMRAQFDF